jgi:hypothetical protein
VDGPLTAGVLLGSASDAVIAAPTIQGTTVQGFTVQGIAILGNLTDSTVLIGARLGQDGRLGGTGLNADSFGSGTLGDFFVQGSMTKSTVRVGQDPVNGVLDDGNDVIQGGAASTIRSIRIGGAMTADSRFVAGTLPSTAFITGQTITVANDSRFDTDVTAPTLAAQLQMDTGASLTDALTLNPTIIGTLTDNGTVAGFTAGFTGTPTFDILPNRQADGSFTLTRARLEQIHGSPLADGAYNLALVATDRAGNARQVSIPFTLDTLVSPLTLNVAPNTVFVAPGQTTAEGVTLVGQTEGRAEIVLLGAGLPLTATADATGAFTFTNVALALGPNAFSVRATDRAGNQQTTTPSLNVTRGGAGRQ